MAKKKTVPVQPAEKPFRTDPFTALKNLKGELSPLATETAPKPAPVVTAPPEDDSALFLEAMAGVRPLATATTVSSATAAVTADKKVLPPVDSPVKKEDSALFLGEIARLKLDVKFTDSVPQEEELKVLSGNRLSLLKKGVIKVERQLDLHGLTRGEALQELARFVRNAQAKGEKAVLVITGKGLNSTDGPVLQQVVISWLRDAGRPLVTEFAPAPRAMGGNGALVVFLRNSQRKQQPIMPVDQKKEN